jgi:hypothetical protein
MAIYTFKNHTIVVNGETFTLATTGLAIGGFAPRWNIFTDSNDYYGHVNAYMYLEATEMAKEFIEAKQKFIASSQS